MNYSAVAPLVVYYFASLLFVACDARSVASQNVKLALRHGGQPNQNKVQSGLKYEYPFYHTSDELSAEVRRLADADDCRGMMQVKTVEEGDVTLDVINLKKSGANTVNKFAIISGEHARELIGPETVLQMMKTICGDISSGGRNIANLLQDTEFMFIINGNPLSRRKVEEGEYCLRANPNSVDLNRNWDTHWQPGAGSKPFSEIETRLSVRLLESYQPTSFLSVHSGTLGLYMPWAYDTSGSVASRNQAAMMEVLEKLDTKYCRCPWGGAEKEVGYPCPGTSVDYVYDKMNALYSYAFEVWADPASMSSLRTRWQEKVQDAKRMLLLQTNLSHSHFREFFQEFQSDFVHTQAQAEAGSVSELNVSAEVARQCFISFNPNTQELYDKTIHNWAETYLDMVEIIALQLKAKSGSPASLLGVAPRAPQVKKRQM